ncbi:MAG: Pr6Pr family membrane protein [Salinibacterium sp.]|nr:Pr6Pr family membrane protein [Salinibacterium sp.]
MEVLVPARRVSGALRLAAATTLLVALVSQIIEKVVNNDMVPQEYFSYFTIQSAMITIVVLAVGGIMALRCDTDTVLYTTIRVSVLAYSVVTAGVYNLLLRGIPDEGYVVAPWPGEIMHVWIPLIVLLDWLLSPGRPALRWTALRIVVIYPLAWVAFTLVRGAATAWFPYPFLEFSTGFVSVALYIVAIAAFIIGIASLGIAYSRRMLRPRVRAEA